ncbi:MAG: hypothetical protein ACRC37_04655, partial [Lentisphaeria bacterium]
GLLAVLLVVLFATRKTDEQKAIDNLVGHAVPLEMAQLIVKFESKVHAKDNPWKKEDYKLVLNEFAKIYKGLKNYEQFLSSKSINLIEASSEMEVRDLRKK